MLRNRINLLIQKVKRVKSIIVLSPTMCDIVILDEMTSKDVKSCIPSNLVVNILPIRDELPVIKSIYFIVLFVVYLIKFKTPRMALIISILKFWNPKIFITFIDNSDLSIPIKSVFPTINILSIQNGNRHQITNPKHPKLFLDHYFCFGEGVKDMFLSTGHNVRHFHYIGSLRAGLFLAKKIKQDEQFDLCFISDFRLLIDPWDNKTLASYKISQLLFEVVTQFAESNDLKICVAMRQSENSKGINDEYDYYNTTRKCVIMLPHHEYSSYSAIQSSRLSISMGSTLSYEALGLGNRVMIGLDIANMTSGVLLEQWDNNLMTFKLGELQRIHSLDFTEFSIKASKLLQMSDAEYMEYNKKSRKYYMNIHPTNLPQQIIKNKIKEFLA
jgi:surface carbohydrate biosynthesis protein